MKRLVIFISTLAAAAAAAVALVFLLEGILPAIIVLALLTLGALMMFGRELHELYLCRRMPVLPRYLPLRILASLMGVCLTTGALLFLRTFYLISLGGEHIITGEFIVRSLLSSLSLFMLDLDSDTFSAIGNYPHLRSALAVQAVLSFACTVTLVLGMVFSRLRSYMRLRRRLRPRADRNHLYVLFGCGEATELLARQICSHDAKALTVIVDDSNADSDDDNDADGIMGLFRHHRATSELADDIGAVVTVASGKPGNMEYDTAGTDLLGILNLESLRNAMAKLPATGSDAELHIFFLSDDEQANIKGATALASDTTVMRLRNSSVERKFYARARANDINTIVEDLALRRGLELRIIDSSRLAVEQLKADPASHPVHTVHMSESVPATVDSPFECLIIGFGEVGRDSLRFLYEFGAFVDSSSTPSRCVRSPWRCTVVDNRKDILEGSFRNTAPAAFITTAPGPVAVDPEIRFVDIDYRSPDFNTRVLTSYMCRRLNYIVVATGDAVQSVALACSIFTRIRTMRTDLSKLRIMVYCPGPRNELLAKIIDHYNYGYDKGRANVPVIRPFGSSDEVYTFDIIVGESLRKRAQAFHAFYQKCRDASATAEWRRPDLETWQSRRHKLTGMMPVYIANPPLRHYGPAQLDKLRRLHRQESQDAADALHAATKIEVLNRATGGRAADFAARYGGMTGNMSAIRGIGLTNEENAILLRLAMLEHMRWQASHIMAGYTLAPPEQTGCDERTRTHNCIVPWHELDGKAAEASTPEYSIDYKLYDFAVVDSTIRLYLKS